MTVNDTHVVVGGLQRADCGGSEDPTADQGQPRHLQHHGHRPRHPGNIFGDHIRQYLS